MNRQKFLMILDILIALIGLICGLAIIIVSGIYHLNRSYIGISISIACLAYLLLRNQFALPGKKGNSFKWQTSSFIFTIGILVFFVILLASILILKNSLYTRNQTYLTFFLVAILLLIIKILFLDLSSKSKQVILLGEILFLGISYKAGAYFLYPTVSGNDPFAHQRIIETIVTTGTIPFSSYTNLPIMHLLASTFGLITGFSSKESMFFVSILQSIAFLSVFPIGKLLFDTRAGLISTLLLTFADSSVQWGVQIIPMTLGIIFFTLIFLGIFEKENAKTGWGKVSWTIFILIFSIAAIFTHSLATLILDTALIIIAAVDKILNIIKVHIVKIPLLSIYIPLFVGIGMISYWMSAFSDPGINFFSLLVYSTKASLATAEVGNVNKISIAGSFSLSSVFLNDGGWMMMLVSSIIGGLLLFQKRYLQSKYVSLSILVGALLLITYGSALIGAAKLLPERWFSFLYLPCVLLAGFVFSKLFAVRKYIAFSIVFLFLFLTLALMVTQPSRVIPDSPLYAKSMANRQGFYASEISGMPFVNSFKTCTIVSNSKVTNLLPHSNIIDPRDPESYALSGLIVIRNYDIEHGFTIPYPKNQVIEMVLPTEAFLNYLSSADILRIYDSGTEQFYYNERGCTN